MALMLKRQRNGELRTEWYGVYTEDGRRKVTNLNVKVEGKPPASGNVGHPGDHDFEMSRKAALVALKEQVEKSQHKGRAEHLTELLIQSKTGGQVSYTRIEELPEGWLSIARDAPLSEGYKGECRACLGRFVTFMRKRNPKITALYQVQPSDVNAFSESVREEMSPRTYAAHLGILRPAFDYFLPVGMINPFRKGLKGKRRSKTDSSGSVHRIPFSPDELMKLLATANGDEFMRDLIITAACSGMRRSDVCQLKWSAVDFDEGMLAVKTSKTGAEVEIPLFGPLRKVLEARKGNGNAYVFPEAVRMLEENPDGLTWRFKKIVAIALNKPADRTLPPYCAPSEVAAEGIDAIMANLPEGERRDRILNVFRRYCAGETYNTIVKEANLPKTTIAVDLHTVQDLIGKPFMRGKQPEGVTKTIERVTRVKREKGMGMRSASVRDWHALRTTFVTLALSAGVPLELVRRVTGHATADIVLKHYFRPDRKQFRAALIDAMPDVITGKETKLIAVDETTTLAQKLADGKATVEDKKKLVKLLKGQIKAEAPTLLANNGRNL